MATERLTPTMRRHLVEMAEIADLNYGEAGWGPETPGEWRCAEALVRRGLLDRNVRPGRPFRLTSAGHEAGRAAYPSSRRGTEDGS